VRIESLDIERAPGLDKGLATLVLGPGLTVILGPNASGKSTIARAIRALLWPDQTPFDAHVRAGWSTDGEHHTSELFAKKVHWQPPLAATVLPGAASLSRFDIRSLLASEDGGDRRIALQVARELAGGLDLVAAEQSFPVKPRLAATSGLSLELKAASRELQEALSKAKGLHEKEQQAQRLADEIDAAHLAARHRDAARVLLELVDARAELRELEAQESVFSEGLDRLVGDERKRVELLSNQLGQQRLELGNRTEELERIERRLAELDFGEASPDPLELEAWSVRIDQLAKTEQRIEAQREERVRAERALAEARRRIVEEPKAGELTRETLDALAASIDDLGGARSVADATRASVELWEGWAEGEATEALRPAIDALRSWLRTPAATPGEPGPRWLPAALIGCAGIALALGLLFLFTDLPVAAPAAALICVGLALIALGAVARRAPPSASADPLESARRAAERTGLAPTSWTAQSVDRRLAELEARLAGAEQAARAQDRLSLARNELDKAETRAAACAAALADLISAAGIAEGLVGLGAAEQVHALFRWREAEEELACVAAALSTTTSSRATTLDEFAVWLNSFQRSKCGDVAAARAALRAVENRKSDLVKATGEADGARATRTRLESDLDEAERDLAGIWERTGIEAGDLATLVRRLAEHGAWKQHQDSLRDARQQLRVCGNRFEQAGELPHLAGASPESIERGQVELWVSTLSTEADRLGALERERGGLEKEIESAVKGHSLEHALARKRAAEQNVAAEREQAVEDALARLLLENARTQHESDHSPRLMQRAQHYFGRFTHNGWQLELDDAGSFCTRDLTANEVRTLEQLSDGTRVQLLLAARLAALENLEQSSRLPICLDEALSTTDPKRFREIVRALLEVTDEGRQIFYFTSHPAEAEQWKQAVTELGRPAPAVIDLARLQGESADWGGTIPAQPLESDPVPDPAGKTCEQYARALGVKLPDGFADTASWHLYLIAHDRLDTLAECLRWRIATIGQWRATRRADATPQAIAAATARELDLHAALVVTLLPLWRIGRGRPVTWADVEDSDAVTPTYEERVRDALALHRDCPAQFIEEVRAIKGFRKTSASKLEAQLELVGCLSGEEPLTTDELLRRSLAANEAARELGPEKASAFLGWLAALLLDAHPYTGRAPDRVEGEAASEPDPPPAPSPAADAIGPQVES